MGVGIDDVVEAVTLPAVLAGIGLVIAAPLVIAGSRPLAKKIVRGYLDMTDKMKEATAETKEKWADLVAEVQSERQATTVATPTAEPQGG